MSSAIGSVRLHDLWKDYGVVFAGAQKNFGTSGLTFTIVRDDVIDRVRQSQKGAKLKVPLMMDWLPICDTKDYFVNTPSMMAVYISDLMCDHILEMGGIDYYVELAKRKSERLYSFIDSTAGSELEFVNEVPRHLRSQMNVPFVIRHKNREAIEKQLVKTLLAEGYCGIKGHRSKGGLRVSIYNSVPYESVDALCNRLAEFKA